MTHKDIHDNPFQRGGTAGIMIGDITHQIYSSSVDQLLGRWTCTKLQGANNIRTSIFVGYRPCKKYGPSLTYSQHQSVYNALHYEGCLRDLWLTDLGEAIKEKINLSEHVILIADLNESIHHPIIKTWLEQLEL